MCNGDTLYLIDLTTTVNETLQNNNISFDKLVETYLDYANVFIQSKFNLTADGFKINYSSLMVSFLMFLNNSLTGTKDTICPAQLEVVISVLSLTRSLTDNVPLIPIFADCGYIEKTIQWIRANIFASHIGKLGKPKFVIIHNLSRYTMNLNELRRVKAFDILMESKQLVDNGKQQELTKVFGVALIALSTNDEPPKESKFLILETGRTLYNDCKKAGKSRDLGCGGFHLSILLHRTFSNTYVIKDILDSKTNE